MDFGLLEKVNEGKIRKMGRTVKKPCALVIHHRFKALLTRLTNNLPENFLKDNFEAIMFFDPKTFKFPREGNLHFIIPPDIPTIEQVFTARSQIGGAPVTLHLWFLSRITDAISAFLVDSGFAPASLLEEFPGRGELSVRVKKPDITPKEGLEVHNLELDVLPIDDDVATMNSPFAFVRAWYFRDLTVVNEVKFALDKIIGNEGLLSVTAVGSLATAVARMLPPTSDTNSIHVILIDRSTDLVTPAITQMNYEGLICEFMGIDCGLVVPPSSESHAFQDLSSKHDAIFACMRKLNHIEASNELLARMGTVTQAFSKSDGPLTFEEGVERFKNTAAVGIENQTMVDHINLYRALLDRMEASRYFRTVMNLEADLLAGQAKHPAKDTIIDMCEYGCDLPVVLRLMCLESMLNGGTHEFKQYLSSLNFNYGFQMIPYILRLEQIGLLNESQKGFKWKNLISTFQSYVPDWEEKMDQAATSYLGYAPLSVRYVERIADGDFRSVKSAMKDLGQQVFQAGMEGPKTHGSFIVCYIGGCTHSELNSLRRIGDARGQNIQVITSDLFSSSTFFQNLGKEIPGFNPSMGA